MILIISQNKEITTTKVIKWWFRMDKSFIVFTKKQKCFELKQKKNTFSFLSISM